MSNLFQMSKCSLEKKWSEQERKMALQNENKISNQVQIGGIEEQCKSMRNQVADYILAQEKLAKNGIYMFSFMDKIVTE